MKKLVLLVVLLSISLMMSCGEDDEKKGTAPTIFNLDYAPQSAQCGEGGGAVDVNAVMDFHDPDGDVTINRLSGRHCGAGDWQHLDVAIVGAEGITDGQIFATAVVGTDCPPGVYYARISVFDSRGNQSNILEADFELF